MTTMTTQNSGARSVASVKMGNPSLVFGRCDFRYGHQEVWRYFQNAEGAGPGSGHRPARQGSGGPAPQSLGCRMTDLADGMMRTAEPGDRAGRDICVGRLRLPQIGSSTPSHLRQRHLEKYGALLRLEPVHLEPRSHRGMRTGEMKHQGCIAQTRAKSCRTLWTVIRD